MPLPNASVLMNRLVLKTKVRHMLVLIRLIELGSMRRTAKALNMAQPAVTQLVAEMETLLETELFFRHARGVEPTEAAKDLLPIAQRIVSALSDGANTVANRLQNQGGVVRVSASPAALGGLLRGVLDPFARRHPDVQVIISETGATPLTGISENSADIICTREPEVIPKGWQFRRCRGDALIVVCGRSHPLADVASPSLEQLGESRWLMNHVGSVARNRFEEIAVRAGWSSSTRCEIVMHIPDLTREMIETGHYLAILPQSVALPWFDQRQVVALTTDITLPLAPLGYLWKEARAGSATARFAAVLNQISKKS
jgi:DNA-binding transcriptional LysR family regulator